MQDKSTIKIITEEKTKNRIAAGAVGTHLLLLGNEAIARGAIEAGVRLVAAYPGTPSTEIFETLAEAAKDLGFYAEWSVNEKVAFEMAAGAALTGVRAMASMKNAGLNVAMDLFGTLPYGGVRGGLVIALADDPAPLYSSNAQDTRYAVQWASVPCLEPENQQEAKDMTKAAFALSERLELPVVVRSVARISHSSGIVDLGPIEPSDMVQGFNKHWKLAFRWGVYGPPGGGANEARQSLRQQYPRAELAPLGSSGWKQAWLVTRTPLVQQESEASPFNVLHEGSEPLGVVACGMGAAYAREAVRDLGLQQRVWFYKVGVVYPVAEGPALRILQSCRRVLVVEDGGPFVESQLRLLAQEHGIDVEVSGKMGDAVLPVYGELRVDIVRRALARHVGLPLHTDEKRSQIKKDLTSLVTPRSSTLCAGCGHLGTYWALRRAMKLGPKDVPIVNVDIGCYEQAGYGMEPYPEPTDAPSQRFRSNVLYNFLDTCYVMGSSISMALGQQCAGYRDGQIVAIAGDSTFFHTCMPALVDAIWNGTKLTFLVLDNYWTAMTGHQPCPVTGKNALGQPARVIRIEEVAKAMGAGLVEVVDVYDLTAAEEGIRKALAFDGVAVVVARGECALQVVRRSGKKTKSRVAAESCTGCGLCVQLGCPAVTFANKKAGVDPLLCIGCGLCVQVCPVNAIVREGGQ
jgi:indolepyruvate ferredoxin oxidoreductase alpha subunit